MPPLSLFDTSIEGVVECLFDRYNCFLGPKIYTNFGSILIAVNPIYLTSDEYSNIYGQSALANADAHIYGIAKRALDMIRPLSQETIVVIGDSGSGKTVTVGHALDYLTATFRSVECEIFYQKIVTASHLMELFANAQTCLNTNSSRFGKLISLVYSCEAGVAKLEGADVEAFLLEKSRVTNAPEPLGCGENFHILRLLVSKLDDPLLFKNVFSFERQQLVDGSFSFRVAGFTPGLTEKWYSFNRARHLFDTFGCDGEVQMDIFKTLAIVLHLSNLEFVAKDEALGCEIADNLSNVITSLNSLQRLLNISDSRDLPLALSTKPVSATASRRQSVYRKPCGIPETEGRRNSIARLLYAKLFEFVMEKICASVAPGRNAKKSAQLSLLDIFGFENFSKARNDFEQLCINFCNERIQQHFASICIKDVQVELEEEGFLPTDKLEMSYSSNEEVIALFEAPPTGIFCVLDEKCRLNRTVGLSPMNRPLQRFKTATSSHSPASLHASEDFYQTLCHNFRASRCSKIKFPKSGSFGFTVFHYAGTVVYSSENFIEKSRDDVSPDLIAFFSTVVKNRFVSSLVAGRSSKKEGLDIARVTASGTPDTTVRKRSLPAKYRHATSSLISFLKKSSNVHYVRCIRPNGRPANVRRSVSDRNFDKDHVAAQMANAGLVDVLRLANTTGKLSRRFSYLSFKTGFSLVFDRFSTTEKLPVLHENKENLAPSSYDQSSKQFAVAIDNSVSLEDSVKLLFRLLNISVNNKEIAFFGKTRLFLSDELFWFFRRLQHLIIRCAAFRLQQIFRQRVAAKKRALLEFQKRASMISAKLSPVAETIPVVGTAATVSVPVSLSSSAKPPPRPPRGKRKSFFHKLPSLSSTLFVDGDIVSRRRHFTSLCSDGLFASAWFHVRPNRLLTGAHIVNRNLVFQHPSLTDCL